MDYAVTYRRLSQVAVVQGLLHVYLAAQQRKAAPKPWLFHGQVAEPLLFRDSLLTLRDVVNARFYRPDLWKLLDPVVSVEREWVRLECFSSDGGVYARVDLSPDSFHEGELGTPGTTNVDFGPEFAARLATLRPGKDSSFEVGEDSVRLETHLGAAVERKVKLPERWLKGFLQLQAIQRAAQPRLKLDRHRARAMLTALPAQAPSGSVYWASGDARVSAVRSGESTVGVEGIHRLRLLQRLAPKVEALYVWAVDDRAPSFWVADLGRARITLGLSSSVNQGFSGDGEALMSSRRPLATELVERARELAQSQERFSVTELAARLEVPETAAGQVVDLLGEQGVIGYDLAGGVFFPRHLPYVSQGFAVQEREKNSRRLAGAGRATVDRRERVPEGRRLTGWVDGDHARYRVEVTLDEGGAIRDGRCTCPWVLEHGMKRGPCKHILALRLEGDDGERPAAG
jgi:hypothetical protein